MSDPNQPPGYGGPDDVPPTPPPGGYEAPAPPPAGGYGQPDYGQAPYGQPDYGQAAPGQAPYGQAVDTERPGGLGERFLARFIDSVLLAIIGTIIDLLILAGALGLSAGSGLGVGGSYAYAAIAAVIGTVINLGYFGYLESSRGQTLGKLALKLRVQSMTGGLPTFEQAVKRNIWLALPLLGIVPIVGGLVGSLGELVAVIMIAVGIGNDAMRRPWTDKYADTRVVKVSQFAA